MAFVIDDKKLADVAARYRTKIQSTRYFNLADRLGADRGGYLKNNRCDNKTIVNSIERFFGVCGLVKPFASSFGSAEFSGSYGFFCGSVYGDSMLEKYVNETIPVPRIGLSNLSDNEFLAISSLLEHYVNQLSRVTSADIPKLTRGFFQSIANESEQILRNYSEPVEKISKEEIVIGDLKIRGLSYNGKKVLLEEFVKQDQEFQLIEPVPLSQLVLGLDDIGGNYAAKEASRKIIREIERPEVRSAFGRKKSKGIILYGPPGTGKTMLAKAIAKEIRRPFYEVQLEKTLDKWLGNTEKIIAQLMDQKNSVIFFDEFDSLGGIKGSDNNKLMDRITNLIATKLDGVSSADSNVYFAAVNEPTLLDPKLTRPGRFNKAIYVGVPNEQELYEIFCKQINMFRQRSDLWKQKKIDPYAEIDSDAIVKAMYQKSLELKSQSRVPMVGADVEEIINRAVEKVEDDVYQGKMRLPSTQDFIEVVTNYTKITLWKEAYDENIISSVMVR